jgi:uroporphyrinogen-III decarboxylase
MIDTGDPLCELASLFEMGTFTVVALTEPDLFHRALERLARAYHYRTAAVAQALPGRLWRIYGPEYAVPPYLPPTLFDQYAMQYDRPMVDAIRRSGGYARIHCHGRIREVLPLIAGAGADAIDPIEPPPQGDVTLAEVREAYGDQMVLFGNLEASDVVGLPTDEFERKIMRALDKGSRGGGRGFVLMPSACPYGRVLPQLAVRNYEKMVECVERM